jgi:galactokinase
MAHLNGWHPDPVEFAASCSDAEWYVGTRGGIMDQFISLLAVRGHAMYLDCRPSPVGAYAFMHVPLPPGHQLLVVDSGVHHANTTGEFNVRVAACRAGVACLRADDPGMTHLRDVQRLPWSQLAERLPQRMTVEEARACGADLDDVPLSDATAPLRVRACCRHVHSENSRVQEMVTALKQGQIDRVGQLLDAAHTSARDDYAISCPEIEALVDAARAVDGTAGARLTGAGWGGSIVALVCDAAVPEFKIEVARRYREATGRLANVFACRPGAGAGLIAGP